MTRKNCVRWFAYTRYNIIVEGSKSSRRTVSARFVLRRPGHVYINRFSISFPAFIWHYAVRAEILKQDNSEISVFNTKHMLERNEKILKSNFSGCRAQPDAENVSFKSKKKKNGIIEKLSRVLFRRGLFSLPLSLSLLSLSLSLYLYSYYSEPTIRRCVSPAAIDDLIFSILNVNLFYNKP